MFKVKDDELTFEIAIETEEAAKVAKETIHSQCTRTVSKVKPHKQSKPDLTLSILRGQGMYLKATSHASKCPSSVKGKTMTRFPMTRAFEQTYFQVSTTSAGRWPAVTKKSRGLELLYPGPCDVICLDQ